MAPTSNSPVAPFLGQGVCAFSLSRVKVFGSRRAGAGQPETSLQSVIEAKTSMGRPNVRTAAPGLDCVS